MLYQLQLLFNIRSVWISDPNSTSRSIRLLLAVHERQPAHLWHIEKYPLYTIFKSNGYVGCSQLSSIWSRRYPYSFKYVYKTSNHKSVFDIQYFLSMYLRHASKISRYISYTLIRPFIINLFLGIQYFLYINLRHARKRWNFIGNTVQIKTTKHYHIFHLFVTVIVRDKC